MSTPTSKRVLMAVVAALMLASVIAVSSPAEAGFAMPEGERIGGENRYDTAALVSQEMAPYGGKCKVAVANGEDFPDGLAGAVFGFPILLTRADSLPPETAAELTRLTTLCEGQLERVLVLGGTAAVSAGVFNQLAALTNPITINRLGGANRYETAISIAEAFDEFYGIDEGVILATGENFPDALAGGPFSAIGGWPILLNEGNALRPEVVDFLNDQNGDIYDVYILGGTAAVPQSVENQLIFQFGLNVERLAGPNRFDTAVEIAKYGQMDGIFPPVEMEGVPGVNLVNGDAFPDALAAGPLGAMGCYYNDDEVEVESAEYYYGCGFPPLLVEQCSIPGSTAQWHVDNAPNLVRAIGGSAVICLDVLQNAVIAATPTPADIENAFVVNTDTDQARWRLFGNAGGSLFVNAVPGGPIDGAAANVWEVRFFDTNAPGVDVTVNDATFPPFFQVTADFDDGLTRGDVRDAWNATPEVAALATASTGNPGAGLPPGPPPARTVDGDGGIFGETDSLLIVEFNKPIKDPLAFDADLFVETPGGDPVIDATYGPLVDDFVAPDTVELDFESIVDPFQVMEPGDDVTIQPGAVETFPFDVTNTGQLNEVIEPAPAP